MTAPPIGSILVGVDIALREGPDPVLATAAALAQVLRAELHVVHAVESGPVTPPLLPSVTQGLETAARALDLYLDKALLQGQAFASRHVGLDRAHRVLAARAHEVSADLVVVGPHRGGVLGRALGTTTDRLLRTLHTPCWVARGGLDLPLRRLAVATDFSDLSRPALDFALLLARDLGGAATVGAPRPDLDVLNVEWPAALDDDPDREEGVLIPQLADEIAAAKGRTGLDHVAVVHPRVVAALDPSRGILSHAAEYHPGVVVLGTHGHGALARTLLGSVASIVAREAPGHVVLVAPREVES